MTCTQQCTQLRLIQLFVSKTKTNGSIAKKWIFLFFKSQIRNFFISSYIPVSYTHLSFGADGAEFPEASAALADTYGIVMGTSHHEPLMLAHQDWVRNKSKYGNGEWSWVTNSDGLSEFFTYGATHNGQYDNMCTIGMRGDGDATMLPEGSTVEENVTLLKEIITAQKNILSENGLADKPKMIALYKDCLLYTSWDIQFHMPFVTELPEDCIQTKPV